MKYVIHRTSHGYDKEDISGNPVPPHPGAVQEPFPCWDCRTLPTPDAFLIKFAESWFTRGTGHTTWSRGICRKNGVRLHWTLEIPDLFTFINSVGRCVVTPPGDPKEDYFNTGLWHIEIYDDYRE